MRRLFPLSTAAGLSLAAAGCAPAEADVEILDLDGDGIDDGFQDGDDDAPGSPDEDPDEPDDPDDPDEPEATLEGDWALVSFAGYDDEETYERDGCTYTQSFTLFMYVGEGGDGEYRGEMVVEYDFTVEGEDCDYNGSYSGTDAVDMSAEASGDREYEIRVRDWDLSTSCELDSSGDELSCDIGMEWERDG